MIPCMQNGLTATQPRYLLVAQALMREIQSGKFEVGQLLPAESEICERFGVSRHTAREALRRLIDAGMVSRRAGVGTTVQSREAKSRYTASVSDLAELANFNRAARLDIRSEDWVAVAGELAELMPEVAGQRWFRLTALRRVEKAVDPIAYTEILIHPSYEAIRDRMHEPGMMIYDLIEDLHGEKITEMKQEISSVAMTRKIGELLSVRPTTPALRIVRFYSGARESLIAVSINVYPHDRFKLTTRWRLDWDR